jgi:hypothetical protein
MVVFFITAATEAVVVVNKAVKIESFITAADEDV